jgi:hypothetical protein
MSPEGLEPTEVVLGFSGEAGGDLTLLSDFDLGDAGGVFVAAEGLAPLLLAVGSGFGFFTLSSSTSCT